MSKDEGQSHAAELLEIVLAERRHEWEKAQLEKYSAEGKEPPKKWQTKYKPPADPTLLDGYAEVPDGWVVASLEQLTSSVRVICYGILMPKENVSNGVLYVKVRDMRGDVIDVSTLPRTSPEIAAKYARASLRPGDWLLAIRGTYGRVAQVPPELDGGNITQDTARLAINGNIDSRFVAWQLRAPDCQNYFKRVARGVAVKGVNIGDVRPCPIFLPSHDKQKQIVEKVEELLSDLDAGVAALERAKANLKRYRAAVLKAAVEGKLVPQDPNNEPASELLARIKVQRESSRAVSTRGKPRKQRSRGRK